MKGWEAKAAFRLAWAKRSYDTQVKGRSHHKGMSDIDKTTGTYVPLAVLVEKQGWHFDPEGAVKDVVVSAIACDCSGNQLDFE